MSSKAASAVYPHLAAKENVEVQKPTRSDSGPSWAKSTDPMWMQPQPLPNPFDRVLGLRRVVGPNRR